MDLLTVDALARALKVPKSWVYSRTRQAGAGTMPKIKVGRYYRFFLNDVMAWLDKKQR